MSTTLLSDEIRQVRAIEAAEVQRWIDKANYLESASLLQSTDTDDVSLPDLFRQFL
jgi:uncharacterized membrane-anchored protein